MSLNQLNQPNHNHDSEVHRVSQGHNITLGIQQTDRRPFSNTNIPLQFSQNYAIHFQLKNISREVEKMTQKGKHIIQTTFFDNSSSFMKPNTHNFYQNQAFDFGSNFGSNSIANDFKQNKFIPNARKYRHEVQKLSKVQEEYEKNKYIDNQQPKQFTHSKYPKNQTNNKNNLDMPVTQSYYIYFQDNKINQQKETGIKVIPPQFKQIKKQKDTLPQNKVRSSLLNVQKSKIFDCESDEGRTPPIQAFSKLQPQAKWVLQKKVKRLQKDLNQLKRKQDKREKIKNFAQYQPKKDSKVQVGKQVQQLINSLWP